MKRFVKIISLVLTLAMVFSVMSVGAWATIGTDVTIKVVDEGGNPLEGATVELLAGSGSMGTKTTDAYGEVMQYGLLDGTYAYQVSCANYLMTELITFKVEEGQVSGENVTGNEIAVKLTKASISFTLVKEATVAAGSAMPLDTTFTFKITKPEAPDEPAETKTAEITVEADDYVDGVATVSKEVTFTFESESEYWAWASSEKDITIEEVNLAANWTCETEPITVKGNELNGESFTFENTYDKPSVTIKVVDENGDVLEGAKVYLGAAEPKTTDSNGLVNLGALEDDIYSVTAEMNGYYNNSVVMEIDNGAVVPNEMLRFDNDGNVVITLEKIPEISFEIVKNVELAAGSEEAPETTFTFEVKCEPAPVINALEEDEEVVLDPEDFTFTTTITVPAGESSVTKKVTLDINDQYLYGKWTHENAVITIREVNDGAENWTYDKKVYQTAGNELAGSYTFTNTYNKPAEVPPVVPPVVNEVEPEKDKIIVKKIWVGDDETVRPDEIEVRLLRNGRKHQQPVELSASKHQSENWKDFWYVSDIEDYKWSVEEIEVPEGYECTVKQVKYNYFEITNTYVGEKKNPETGVSDFVGAAVALAVCSTVCGAALILKRK